MVKKILLISLLVGLMVGCSYNVQLTKKDASLWMLDIYNAQYEEYKTWFVVDPATGKFAVDKDGNAILKPGTPDKQITILQTKKKIFTEVWPLILIYAQYADTGEVPPGTLISTVEARAINLINELVRME
jgi:hypothetical protein